MRVNDSHARTTLHFILMRAKDQVFILQRLRRPNGNTACGGAHLCQQHIERERFGQIVVGPGIQPMNDVAHRIAS